MNKNRFFFLTLWWAVLILRANFIKIKSIKPVWKLHNSTQIWKRPLLDLERWRVLRPIGIKLSALEQVILSAVFPIQFVLRRLGYTGSALFGRITFFLNVSILFLARNGAAENALKFIYSEKATSFCEISMKRWRFRKIF